MSALADYLDARMALVHEWHGQGVTAADIVRRLTPDEQNVRDWLRGSPMPFPGSSRYQAIDLRRRVRELEAQLHVIRTTPPPVAPPTVSELRALSLDPHPAACGCQYWIDTPLESAGDQHNPHCEHAPKQR